MALSKVNINLELLQVHLSIFLSAENLLLSPEFQLPLKSMLLLQLYYYLCLSVTFQGTW